ncbi:hypothetical protein ASC80_00990 [Afipia sp. Root123D2]|nr:hypothetical protein ASC80_00990 [Afipia sp. Root123D2]
MPLTSIDACWIDDKMAFEPSCCEYDDCLKCAGLREEMCSTWYNFDTRFSSQEFQCRLIEFDQPGISTSHDQGGSEP